MRDPNDTIREALMKAHNEKRLISCKVPGGGDMAIALEKHMVDQALKDWRDIPEIARASTLGSVRRTIKRAVKRMKQGRATDREMDELAADVALWLAHDLLFADGERHLIKGPSKEDLLRKVAS